MKASPAAVHALAGGHRFGMLALPGAHPSQWFALLIGGFFATMLVMPVEPVAALSGLAVLYWLLVAVAFGLGLTWGQTAKVSSLQATPALPRLEKAARMTVGLGTVGLALLVFDRFVIRGAPLEFDFFAVRDALEDTPPGLVGTVAAFLGAFAPFGWIVCRVASTSGGGAKNGAGLGLLHSWLGFANMVGYVLLSVMAGSRSVMLVVVVVHAVALVHLVHGMNRRVLGMAMLAVAVLLLSAGTASALIMLERLDQMGLDPMTSIQYSGYAEALQPSQSALAWLDAHPDSSAAMAAFFSLALYVYHGFFEFAQLFTDFAATHTHGALLMWLPLKLLSVTAGLDLTVDPGHLDGVREGIFTTLVGPLFIDFGWAAPLMALLLGAALGRPAALLKAGHVGWLPTACLTFAVLVFFPMLSLLDSAAGAYLLVAAVGIAILSRDKPRTPAPSGSTAARATSGSPRSH